VEQARRQRQQAATPIPDPVPIPTAGGFVTAAYIASLGLDPTTAAQQLQDAQAVYAEVEAMPWITQDQLVAWANPQWGTSAVARLNAAVATLQNLGLILSLA
jgi:hypothetical protein